MHRAVERAILTSFSKRERNERGSTPRRAPNPAPTWHGAERSGSYMSLKLLAHFVLSDGGSYRPDGNLVLEKALKGVDDRALYDDC